MFGENCFYNWRGGAGVLRKFDISTLVKFLTQRPLKKLTKNERIMCVSGAVRNSQQLDYMNHKTNSTTLRI